VGTVLWPRLLAQLDHGRIEGGTHTAMARGSITGVSAP